MADALEPPWSHPVRLSQAERRPSFTLRADAETRARVAKALGLGRIDSLEASLSLEPWLDGAQLLGEVRARVEQVCGVTLEPFDTDVVGPVEVRMAPAGSPNLSDAPSPELELDPEAPDPPDVIENDSIDLGAYAVEHLALALDPFPRKPGATFDYTPDASEESPFAALRVLQNREPKS